MIFPEGYHSPERPSRRVTLYSAHAMRFRSNSMERFIAAAVQMASGPDRNANVVRASALVREAASRGAQLVVLPEVFAWRGPRTDETAHAEPVPGPTSETMAKVARESRVYLCAGSLLEAVPGDRPASAH